MKRSPLLSLLRRSISFWGLDAFLAGLMMDVRARRCRLPTHQLSLPLTPAPLQRSRALPLLPGYCQALLGLGGVVCALP